MQFVDHQVPQPHPAPPLIRPLEPLRPHHRRRPRHPVRLPKRTRIRPFLPPIQHKNVPLPPRHCTSSHPKTPPLLLRFHPHPHPPPTLKKHQANLSRIWRPHPPGHTPIPFHNRPTPPPTQFLNHAPLKATPMPNPQPYLSSSRLIS
jgi:hypothetical protein